MSKTDFKNGVSFSLISVVLVTVAQISMKLGVTNLSFKLDNLVSSHNFYQFIVKNGVQVFWLGLGLACYALSMMVWVLGLKYLPLSIAYPLLSISYVLVYFASMFVPEFNESFSSEKLAGIVLIIIGLRVLFSEIKIKS